MKRVLTLLAITIVAFGLFSVALQANAQAQQNQQTAQTTNDACVESAYEDYAGCTGQSSDIYNVKCLRVLPPCFKCGACQLDDFIWLFVNMGMWGVRVLPVVAMLFFIWAGFGLLTSRGNPEKVQGARRFLGAVVWGVIVVLVLGYVFTAFVVQILTGSTNVFGRPWYGESTSKESTATQGCCVTLLGCFDQVSQTECTTYDRDPFKPAYWQQGQLCGQITLCQNLDRGCCVPLNYRQQKCEVPEGSRGCVAYPNTFLREGKACSNIPECSIGCCVPICDQGYEASLASCDAANGTWHAGACQGLETEVGCCRVASPVGQGNCFDVYNKQRCVDGGGIWDDQSCASSGLECNYNISICRD